MTRWQGRCQVQALTAPSGWRCDKRSRLATKMGKTDVRSETPLTFFTLIAGNWKLYFQKLGVHPTIGSLATLWECTRVAFSKFLFMSYHLRYPIRKFKNLVAGFQLHVQTSLSHITFILLLYHIISYTCMWLHVYIYIFKLGWGIQNIISPHHDYYIYMYIYT